MSQATGVPPPTLSTANVSLRYRSVTMRVRLTVKLAEIVNGVDLSQYREGDIIELSNRDAAMLIAGAWAERVTDIQPVTSNRRRSAPVEEEV